MTIIWQLPENKSLYDFALIFLKTSWKSFGFFKINFIFVTIQPIKTCLLILILVKVRNQRNNL